MAAAAPTLIDSSVPSSDSRPLAARWSEPAGAAAKHCTGGMEAIPHWGGGVTESHG